MTKALELLARFPQAQVLCLGDLMLDRYIYGSADRLSPEAPVPIVRVQSRKIMPGGLGNVAKNLATLGVKVWAVGLVGDDGPAEDLRLLMKKALDPIEPIFLKDPRRPTTVKTRLIAGIQQVVRYDEESDAFLEGSLAELYQAEVARILPQVKAVALSDYGKGVLSPKIASWLISQAQSLNIPTVVDPKGADYSPYRGATVVTPNCQELSLAVGRPLKKTDPLALAQAGQELMARHDLKNLVITRSEEGMTLLTESGKIHHLPTRAQAVYDVSGAGDTVMGVLTAALACGADLLVGAVLASRAAGVVVGKVGTAVATPEEIRGSVA
ncbi:MAG: D-glycero-beta-D-manno-heptose-7-phosphate kinase [Deltaproteobacteria bacterium]|jgi:D-beta-D-heptose 7-phosphate kinase/D-beta-D-heptose 1-phosphate adenosyltransferase|nr:D-glycero-beta-D-manno-heptose-7-phosphate kinase [Deltaproteobacteria bacterium]